MATEQIDTSLEDEKLISHLSGTLTFSDIASLDNAKSGLVDSSSSNPANETTENDVQAQRMKVTPQTVRFEVINASIIEEKGDKHVVSIEYTILVMQSIGFDSMPGKIHKRYSEMSSLKHKLEMAYPSLMHDVPFPPKRIVGNFSPTTLSCRSKAFEKFLTYIFSVKELRFSKPFIRFLYGNSLLEGYRLIENGLYERASDMLVSSWKLQNKIVPTKSYQCLMTLVAIVASYCALSNVDQAQLFADLSLQSLPDSQRDNFNSSILEPKWLVAILRTNLKLCQALGRDTKRYETRLQDLNKKGISIDQRESLLEMVLHSKQMWHSIVEEGMAEAASPPTAVAPPKKLHEEKNVSPGKKIEFAYDPWIIQTYIMHVSILQRQYISDIVKAEIILESRWKGQKGKDWLRLTGPTITNWSPDIGIVNSLGRLRISSKLSQYSEYGQQYFLERKRFKGRFVQKPSWSLFPFDIQKFRVILKVTNKEFPLEFKIDPKGAEFGQSTVYSCLEPKEYIAGDIQYKAEASVYSASIDAFVPIYRNSFTYVSYFFYDFSLGCMALMPYALPDSYCDFRIMFYAFLLILFIVSELKAEYLRPATGNVSYMDRYHAFVLFFITLNLLICALQVLYLGLSDDYQLGGGELLSGELLLFLPPGILFLVSNIWFLIIITATFRRLILILKSQHQTMVFQ